MKFLKKLFIICLVIILYSGNISAQTCDCTIVPYKPAACYKICTSKIVNTADTLEMRIILGLSSDVTKRVDSLRSAFANHLDSMPSLKRYKEFLTKEEYQQLNTSLNTLNNAQAKYFAVPLEDRKKVITNFDKIINDK
jgi:hypothetical protein